MHEALGEKLLTLCSSASNEVFLASPFIKLEALEHICAAVPAHIPMTIIARFSESDLQAGVSDLEVIDLLSLRDNANFLIHPALHAKLYRADNQVLIGSANITSKGLGWCALPNIEILTNLSASEPHIVATEKLIRENSFPITPERYLALKAAIARRPIVDKEKDIQGAPLWIPSCRRPELLNDIHHGRKTSLCTDDVLESAKLDLQALSIPSWLSDEDFTPWLNTVFRTTPIYGMLVDRCRISNPFEDKEALEWIESLGSSTPLSAKDAWESLKAWIRFLNPDIMVIPVSEALILARRI